MKKFETYKKMSGIMKVTDVYGMVFNTKLKKVAANSLAAFCAGTAAVWIFLAVAKSIYPQKGVGGLETVGAPEFNEAEFNAALQNKEDDAFLVPKGDAEADSIDAVSAVFDDGKSDGLYYYTYRVKQGDMIGHIADMFNVTQDTIISVNDIHQSRLLQIGKYLKIPSIPGILYTVRNGGETIDAIAEKYEVSAEKCARVNALKQDASLAAGTAVFVPDAQLDWVTKQEINGDLFVKPLRARYYLSSYYGWRSSPFTGKRSFHSGIDMAAPTGTSVYASLSGTVTTVGFSTIYGNYIIITHHSGYKTLYGHLSATLVTSGAHVDSNTRIGKVGNTGMSTGPHLHFTVFKSGKTVNPLAFLK